MSILAWKDYLRQPRSRREILIAAVLLALVMWSFGHFVDFVEDRPGVRLNDPLLAQIPAIDLTWITFALVYGALAIGVFALLRNPVRLVFAMQLYALMVFSRILAMYLLPLDPPQHMILLRDPVVEWLGGGRTLTRDLFFSGHTATLFVLYLTADRRIIRGVFLLLTGVVGLALLAQHVHYSIDVVAALFFTYADYVFLHKLRGRRHVTPGMSHASEPHPTRSLCVRCGEPAPPLH